MLLGRVSKLTTSSVVVLVVIPSVQWWLKKNMLTTSSTVALAIPSAQVSLLAGNKRGETGRDDHEAISVRGDGGIVHRVGGENGPGETGGKDHKSSVGGVVFK